jgi:ribonuclease HI
MEDSIRCSRQRPCEGRLKINVDASFTPETGAATVGIVGRDYHGVIAMAASINIAKCCDTEEAEACAIREGIKMGLDLNLLQATIESDCAIAVAAANKLQTKASRCWSVYKDIAHLKAASPGCEITSTSRLCNSVAHKCG